MAYQPPGVRITQNFVQTPTSTTPILSALVIGPQYDLHRYLNSTEKASTAVTNPTTPSLGNAYQDGSNVTYAYPNLPSGNVVDQSFVQVNMDGVYGQYLPNAALGSTTSNNVAALVPTVSSAKSLNSLRFTNGSSTVLQTANGYTLSSWFSNRPPQIGDVAIITDNLSNTWTTTVTGLLADTYITNPSGGLGSTVGTKTYSSTTGSASGSTTTFTDSAGGLFTTATIGQFISITNAGSISTYQILAVAANGFSATLSGTPAAGSGLSYYVGGVSNDPSNIASATGTTGSVTYAWKGSGSNPGTTGITVVASGSFAYVGYNNQRVLSDTYTCVCTTGGGAGTAVFTVSSLNNVFTPTSVTMNGSGIVAVDTNGSNNVRLTFTFSAATVTAGQSWSIPVTATVTQVEPTGAGTYTGTSNIVYKLTVTKGGPLYTGSNGSTAAIVSITSNNVDSSPSVQPTAATAFAVGTLGVTASFASGSNNSGLILGDVYYVNASAPILGAVKTLQFADNIPTASYNSASSWNIVLAELQNGVLIPSEASPSTYNWTTTASGITINAGINTYDPNLLTSLGVQAALPIIVGNIFVTYRDLVTTNSSGIGSITSTAAIPAILGEIDPSNPIAQGVYEALLNSAGATVYYLTLTTDDINGYNNALAIAAGANYVYGLVPLSTLTTVQSAFAAHVAAQSTPTIGQWRVTWLHLPLVATSLLYSLQPNGQPWLATVSADPLSSTTSYSLVTVPGATFVTSGVRAGDSVLINFVTSPTGVVSYTTLTVAQVRSQTTLTITAGLPAAISVGTKFQLQRNYSSAEQAANLGAQIAAYNNRRVICVVPGQVISSGVTMSGVFLAAACAGLASGVPANQGLTNSTVLGFDTLNQVLYTLKSTDLNTLAGDGAFIVTQSVPGATPYVRQQLTSAEAGGNLNASEYSVTSNVDSISYQLNSILKPFIGVYNINASTLALIKAAITGLLNDLQSQPTNATAGAQLLPGSQIVSIAQDPTFQDRVNVALQLVVPYPLNILNVNLTVGQNGVTISTD